MKVNGLRLAELIGSLSHALDMTEGQPRGHCIRCCWIGSRLAERLGLDARQCHDLYYTLLLKDLGCSSNAARICELYLTDDLHFKRDFKLVDGSLSEVVNFVLGHTGLQADLLGRFRSLFHIFRNGDQIANELIQTRCHRGADIARQLRFSEDVAAGILSLDEHWNGKGRPLQLAGEAIPLFSRIALLCQVVDVFHAAAGPDAALKELRERSGHWFDPALVSEFEGVADDDFWQGLADPRLAEWVFVHTAGQGEVELDEDYLDEIAAAFGQVVDSKSPYTAGHSGRVALYTDILATQMGLSESRRRWLKRGALLHDVGKLGVSNSILDKPGKLDAEEWAAVQMHAAYTEEILSRIGAFEELAQVAGAHHERLDGKGYPKGLQGDEIALETRIITTADIFDAITAKRPYRGAIPVPQALEMMAEHLGTAIDPDCFAALQAGIQDFSLYLTLEQPLANAS
ncbi:HD-GYP domain-containing protein [Aeromonas enteropelogenes]|uniref:HD-GYP domain-containing protein n=1 Tax=Aeromonas enteropelogenes TaxID=29489 RepID=UPI000F529000|nr:HD-GYP domain-containing protein [Aeromonas enteropelogenes]RQM71045.1 HD-GYP domain-containing protein [Aeromonas enteropelogenes]